MPILISTSTDGLEVVRVANDVLSLTFLPQCGGRLISLKYQDRELLWANPKYLTNNSLAAIDFHLWPKPDSTMGSWINLGGSKTWPAPQGWSNVNQWPGPPDDVLDSGTYSLDHEVSAEGDIKVTLTSPCDDRTGIQIIRAFTIPKSGTSFFQKIFFRNHSTQVRTWSIWEVVQVATKLQSNSEEKGYFLVETESQEIPKILFHLVGDIEYSFTKSGVKVPVQDSVGKVGFTRANGNLSWVRPDGLILQLQFEPLVDASYPDGGCSVELWHQFPLNAPMEDLGGLQPDAHLVEMEILSPLHEIAPGEMINLNILWSLSNSTKE